MAKGAQADYAYLITPRQATIPLNSFIPTIFLPKAT